MTDSNPSSDHTNPMIDFRLRRPASLKAKTADTAAHVAQVVGSSLREIRRSQGHSLDTLAAASGVSRAMLGQIETGKSVPTITVLWKVAAALGVPVAQLITDPEASLYTVTRRSGSDGASVDGKAVHIRNLARPEGQVGYSVDEFRVPVGHKESFAARRDGGAASLIVASGTLDVSIGDEAPVTLGEGDCIHFPAGLKHTFANNSSGVATAYLVVGASRKVG
jgi:transcriptional regulator with XRE-family HTH domain